jgi:hypothetical protein
MLMFRSAGASGERCFLYGLPIHHRILAIR